MSSGGNPLCLSGDHCLLPALGPEHGGLPAGVSAPGGSFLGSSAGSHGPWSSSFFRFQAYPELWEFLPRPWGLASHICVAGRNVPEAGRLSTFPFASGLSLRTQGIHLHPPPLFTSTRHSLRQDSRSQWVTGRGLLATEAGGGEKRCPEVTPQRCGGDRGEN